MLQWKNKLFFSGTRGFRRAQGTIFDRTVPTAAERSQLDAGAPLVNLQDYITGQSSATPNLMTWDVTAPVEDYDPATTRLGY